MSAGIEKGIHFITLAGTQITHLINVDYQVANALRKITTKDSTSSQDEYGAGTVTHTFSAQAFFAEDAAFGFNEIQKLCKDGTNTALVFQTGVTGDVAWTAAGFIATTGQTSPNLDGSGTIDMTYTVTGVVTEGTD